MSPRHNLSFCACKTAWFAPEWQVYMGSSHRLCFFFMQNRDFMTRLTRLYGAQTSSMVFACKIGAFGLKLHVSMRPRTHLWFSACKTPCLASELLVSMGPRPHLSFCPCKSAWLAPEILVSMCPRHNLSFCACKTAWLAPEILVSMGPSPHLWFLHAKQRLLV